MSDLFADFDGKLIDGLEFCRKTYALFDSMQERSGGVERLRAREGIAEKRLIEELLPICRYVQTYYRLGRYISVRWVNGSQSYDAELQQRGQLVTQGVVPQDAYLEATCAMHPNEHWIGKLLNAGKPAFGPDGISKKKGQEVESVPVVFTNNQHVVSFAFLVQRIIEKKCSIRYPAHTSLVIQCHLNTLFTQEDWRELISLVEAAIESTPFQEVLLFDGVTERAMPLVLQRS
jgi:hypothetical protein